MTQSYDVIPAGYLAQWSPDTAELARSLVAGADGERGTLAALSLIFRLPSAPWAREDIRARYITEWTPTRSIVLWPVLHHDATQGALPVSRGERALFLLACSIADERCVVQLAAALRALDNQLREAIAPALAYASGRIS